MESIIDAIENSLNQGRTRTSFTYLANGEDPETPVSLLELRQVSLRIASLLPPQSTVILLLPQGTDFIKAFFGCLYAQAIAVPVALPTRNRGLDSIRNIVADASISIGITSRNSLTKLQSWFGEDGSAIGVRWLFVEDFPDIGTYTFDRPKSQQLAFLQYTSGSTGMPKAVMVTHENIVANSRIIQKCFQNTTESVSVCWLPSFHDMGLMDGIIQPVFSGFPSILMSPLHFVQRPARWLNALTRYRATYSGGPNFAYDFCVDRIKEEELSGLDLSHLQCLYNGSEPVRLNTIRRFAEHFSSAGFNITKMLTCYGLAEATLAVATSKLGQAPGIVQKQGADLVSSGGTHEDTKVRIVNPETAALCADGDVGEVWASGKSISPGYWNRPNQTADAFVDLEGERYLRTGDLGFLWGDELFVTGRIKDLIIIRGKNHYPQDIEQTVFNAHPSLQPNGGAAFPVEWGGEESLVVVQEIRRSFSLEADYECIINEICSQINQHHGLRPLDVIIVRPGTIPKTTSGKLQRSVYRQLWNEARLKPIATLQDYILRRNLKA